MARLVRPQDHADSAANASPRGLIELTLLLGGGASLALALWRFTGAPALPSTSPDSSRIGDVLSGSYLPYDGVISVLTVLAWLALAYLAATLIMRLLCETAVRLSDGSSWARVAHKVSDLVTVPVVRQIVDGSVAGSLVLAAGLRTNPTALAEQPRHMPVVAVAMPAEPVPTHLAEPTDEIAPLVDDPSSYRDGYLSYTVIAGDSLWGISRRVYGDGTLYRAIFEANEGRVMSTGEMFSNPRLIRPGWVLSVPLPGHNVWLNGSHVMYRVREGDSLWRISESLLASGLRWTEIWELNEGSEVPGGRRFTNPGYILPGWVLEIPSEIEVGAPAPPQVAQPEESSAVPSMPPTVASTVVPTSPPETTPTAASLGAVEPTPGTRTNGSHGRQFPLPVEALVATAAGLAAAGGIALIVRQLARRDGASPSIESRRQGAARGRAAGDAGKVIAAARALMQGLAEFGFDDLRLILVKESERFLEFTLECALGDADAAVSNRYDLGRRLACAIDGEVLSPTRIRLKLSRFQRLAALLMDEPPLSSRLLIVPAGATDRSVYYLNLAGLGNVLLIGRTPDCWKVVSAWLETVSAVFPPEEVAFLAAGDAPGKLGDEMDLPHFFAASDTDRRRSLEDLAGELEETIIARASSAPAAGERVPIVAIVGQADSEDMNRLETALRRGPESGITLVCLAPNVDQVQAVDAFAARLAFGMPGSVPDEYLLSLRGEAEITLRPVEVRRRAVAPAAREHNGVQQPESPVADTEPPPIVPTDNEVQEPIGRIAQTTTLEADESKELSSTAEPAEAIAVEPVSRQSPLMTVDAEEAEAPQAGATGPIFSVCCFGTFQVEVNGREITEWSFQKARELLAYLIARGGSRATRDEAAEALWPDGELGQVEHQLSNAAYYLRRALKAASSIPDIQPLDTSDRRYRLRSGMFRADVDRFDAHLRRAESLSGPESLAEYERALEIYRGDFLAGELYEWADVYRREYQRRYVGAAHRAANLAAEYRDFRKAIAFYEGMLARDAIDEDAARGLMRCQGKLGDTNGVRRVYKRLREALRRELEDEKAEPLPETTALFQELTATRDR